MAFSVPTFNLICNIITGPWPGSLRATVPCNLALGRRVPGLNNGAEYSGAVYGYSCSLLLPKGTDIRDASCGLNPDVVEVPAFSGRYYNVNMVDDVGKGFANEYRFATLGKIFEGQQGSGSYPGLFWPTPIT